MPIYEYRCAECGFQDEFLQKLSDPQLTVCPSCGKETFKKQLTAAGFQLKGSGWYATDFKGSGAKPAAKTEGESKADAKGGDDKPAAASTDKPSAAASEKSSESGSDKGTAAAKSVPASTSG